MTVIASDLKLYTYLDGQQQNEEEEEDEITETINEQERPIDTVTLEYPGDNAQEVFPLVVSLKDSEYSPVHDLYTTVQMIVKECIPSQNAARFGDRKSGLVRDVMSACRKRKVADVKNHINSFNKLLGTLKEEGIFETNEITGEPASGELTHHILEQAYARAVAPEAHTLRQYQGIVFPS